MNHAYTFLFGMLGAMFVFGLINKVHTAPKPIATVNITRIINQFTQAEAKKEISDDLLKQEIKSFGKQLEKTLQIFSEKNHLVLVPSEAVIAGCDDYTSVVMQEMMKK